jgi:hypothetical protein
MISSHHDAHSIATPVGAAQHCPYKKGSCILADKTALIWEPNPKQFCKFRSIGEFSGRSLGNAWLTDDGQLGLTTSNTIPISECGLNLTITDQGLAFKTIDYGKIRSKRSANPNANSS